MPRAIVMLRRYPATMLLAVLLFAVSLVLAAASLGTVSGGGEGDDSGSGIGGTGKSGEFGGSGFGGTGGPSPFFTSSSDSESNADQQEEAESQIAATQQVAETVLDGVLNEIPSVPANEPKESHGRGLNNSIETATSTPTQQVPAIQIEIAQAPVVERLAAPTPVTVPEPVSTTPSNELVTADTISPANVAAEQTRDSLNMPSAQPAASQVEPVSIEKTITPEALAVVQEAEKEIREEPLERASVPDRIQRPDLPPFQRIRPVERPSLMPGRAQPMRI
ncbi:MAG: hypothetical protein RL572_1040 [Pseudomonadota bacterium]|jgi:hypothetical protein